MPSAYMPHALLVSDTIHVWWHLSVPTLCCWDASTKAFVVMITCALPLYFNQGMCSGNAMYLCCLRVNGNNDCRCTWVATSGPIITYSDKALPMYILRYIRFFEQLR